MAKKSASGEFNCRLPNPDDFSLLLLDYEADDEWSVHSVSESLTLVIRAKDEADWWTLLLYCWSAQREKYNEFKKKRYAELKASSPDSVRSPVLYPTLSACFTISLGRKPSFADHFFHILKTVLQRNAVISAEWKESKENPNFVNGEQEKKSGGKKWRMGVEQEREKE